jgi:hypothetical protein
MVPPRIGTTVDKTAPLHRWETYDRSSLQAKMNQS